jgi:hypothetical protein
MLLRLALKTLSRTDQPRSSSWNLITEKHHHFDPDVLQPPDHSYLLGYWQSDRFQSIEAILRSDFRFTHPLSDEAEAIATTIRSIPHSVRLRVRRGAFVHNPVATRWQRVCLPRYCAAGVSLLHKKLKTLHCGRFPGDSLSCGEHPLFAAAKMFGDITRTGNKTAEHLALMSL